MSGGALPGRGLGARRGWRCGSPESGPGEVGGGLGAFGERSACANCRGARVREPVGGCVLLLGSGRGAWAASRRGVPPCCPLRRGVRPVEVGSGVCVPPPPICGRDVRGVRLVGEPPCVSWGSRAVGGCSRGRLCWWPWVGGVRDPGQPARRGAVPTGHPHSWRGCLGVPPLPSP